MLQRKVRKIYYDLTLLECFFQKLHRIRNIQQKGMSVLLGPCHNTAKINCGDPQMIISG